MESLQAKSIGELYQCSLCTAASVFCSLNPSKKCTACNQLTPHLCSTCIQLGVNTGLISTCYKCTARPHICLSKCAGGCKHVKERMCKCEEPMRRLQVKKQNKNQGRYFYTCRKCDTFLWESDPIIVVV
jgi:hypothetical protein